MSTTWLDNIKNPNLAADYRIVGDRSDEELRKLVRALELHKYPYNVIQFSQLEAAKRIIAHNDRQRDKERKLKSMEAWTRIVA